MNRNSVMVFINKNDMKLILFLLIKLLIACLNIIILSLNDINFILF
jgi:hypothetical protein